MIIKGIVGTTLAILALGASVIAEETPIILFDFTGTDAAKEWQTVNDGVKGGVSKGEFKITDERTLEFFGKLSLENNGGFASVRSKTRKLDLEKGDTLVAKVRGDGREYTLNLYLDRRLTAFSYRATVETKKDEWIEIKASLDKFEATSFGRVVKDAGKVKPDEINSVGFLLSDRKPGPFKMEKPENFHIPPNVIKRHVTRNQFVELRIDSPRFSMQITSPPSLIPSTSNTRK